MLRKSIQEFRIGRCLRELGIDDDGIAQLAASGALRLPKDSPKTG